MDDSQLATRFAAIEHQLRVISDHLGIACPTFPSEYGPPPGWASPQPGLPPDVQALKQSGNLIGAIKRYREITGVGLAEAKAAVESL